MSPPRGVPTAPAGGGQSSCSAAPSTELSAESLGAADLKTPTNPSTRPKRGRNTNDRERARDTDLLRVEGDVVKPNYICSACKCGRVGYSRQRNGNLGPTVEVPGGIATASMTVNAKRLDRTHLRSRSIWASPERQGTRGPGRVIEGKLAEPRRKIHVRIDIVEPKHNGFGRWLIGKVAASAIVRIDEGKSAACECHIVVRADYPIAGCSTVVKVLDGDIVANALEVEQHALGLAWPRSQRSVSQNCQQN